MYLREAPVGERLPEQSAHASLDPVQRLVGGRAQVEDAVVETGVLVHSGCQLKKREGR